MKKLFLFANLLLTSILCNAQISSIVGSWITIDDRTGNRYAVVRIYQSTDGYYYGRIERLLVDEQRCTKCRGDDKNKHIEGLVILRKLQPDGNALTGSCLDPASGNIYYGKIVIGKDGRLKLRGSIDKLGILGRTQSWIRTE